MDENCYVKGERDGVVEYHLIDGRRPFRPLSFYVLMGDTGPGVLAFLFARKRSSFLVEVSPRLRGATGATGTARIEGPRAPVN